MTKAALFDEEGREIAAVLARSEISHPRPGWAERSMDEAWTSAARAIRNVFTVANANSENVAAVGLTGAMVGVWPIDAKGRPVRQAVLVSRYPRAGSDRCGHGARSTGPEAHFGQ
jgi:sugar (pentulose or hexulose) kinase